MRLAYGRDDLRMPQYDLALLAQQVMGASARDLRLETATDAATRTGNRLISPLTFWVLLGGAVIVLVGLIARLLKQ